MNYGFEHQSLLTNSQDKLDIAYRIHSALGRENAAKAADFLVTSLFKKEIIERVKKYKK